MSRRTKNIAIVDLIESIAVELSKMVSFRFTIPDRSLAFEKTQRKALVQVIELANQALEHLQEDIICPWCYEPWGRAPLNAHRLKATVICENAHQEKERGNCGKYFLIEIRNGQYVTTRIDSDNIDQHDLLCRTNVALDSLRALAKHNGIDAKGNDVLVPGPVIIDREKFLELIDIIKKILNGFSTTGSGSR